MNLFRITTINKETKATTSLLIIHANEQSAKDSAKSSYGMLGLPFNPEKQEMYCQNVPLDKPALVSILIP